MKTCTVCGADVTDKKFCPQCGAPVSSRSDPAVDNQSLSLTTCPRCGAEVERGATYCLRCGSALNVQPQIAPAPIICSNCGRQNDPGSRFCAGCGRALTPYPAPATSGAPTSYGQPERVSSSYEQPQYPPGPAAYEPSQYPPNPAPYGPPQYPPNPQYGPPQYPQPYNQGGYYPPPVMVSCHVCGAMVPAGTPYCPYCHASLVHPTPYHHGGHHGDHDWGLGHWGHWGHHGGHHGGHDE